MSAKTCSKLKVVLVGLACSELACFGLLCSGLACFGLAKSGLVAGPGSADLAQLVWYCKDRPGLACLVMLKYHAVLVCRLNHIT
mmetsp:Transcript_32388/g.67662  ORF Transcript_32388/g.67662 Transcript_32388/m.67662 type:complete len:84 (+) Transcript_32388:768-1019(+)